MWEYRTGLGQDHHAFVSESPDSQSDHEILLAGVPIPHDRPFLANSDGDVLLHALINACSSLSGVPFLGPPADALCQQGIRDSKVYFQAAWAELQRVHPGVQFVHVSISIEALRPKLYAHLPCIRQALSNLLDLPLQSVGITATTGEGLTGMGQGRGMAVLALLTVRIPCSDGERG